jgi:hypothetical protein
MNLNQKLGQLAVLPLAAFACILNADVNPHKKISDLESRISALEYQCNSCMINPPARPTQKCDWGALITVDALLLKAQENGLEFAVTTQNGPDVDSSFEQSVFQGKSEGKSLDFDWDWGVRVGLGANLPRDGWDVVLNWTHFLSTSKTKVTPGAGESILTTFLNTQDPDISFGTQSVFAKQSGTATGAISSWRLLLNELDLELGRQFYTSDWLTLKPHAGLRTAWIHQKDNVSYTGLVHPLDTNEIYFNEANVNMKNNFWGLGLLGGLDTQWGIGCGWSVLANFAASILYGYFDNNHTESAVVSVTPADPADNPANLAVGDTDTFFEFHRFNHVGRFITDFILGIRYDRMFCCDAYHLGFDVGWEHHLFFGQNQFIYFDSSIQPAQSFSNQGDLYLQGVSFKVRFDF